MSSPKEEKKGRVEVNDLPRKEEELKDEEAKEIKGGAGSVGASTGSQDATENDPERFGAGITGGVE